MVFGFAMMRRRMMVVVVPMVAATAATATAVGAFIMLASSLPSAATSCHIPIINAI